MRPLVVAAAALALTACASAHGDPRRTTPRDCDARGVWRIELTADDVLEVTVDPALVRVELPGHSVGTEEGVAVAVDTVACRLHVVRRTTQHYEEGYGDTDTTLRLQLVMRGTRAAVTGTERVVTLDPAGEVRSDVRATAIRRAGWSP